MGEIDLVSGSGESENLALAASVAGIVAGGVSIGLAFSAAGPVGFGVGFALGATGVFTGSVGVATSGAVGPSQGGCAERADKPCYDYN